MPESKLSAILRALCENHIDFIVVGGVAAVLHGAPIQTYDLDAVFSRAPGNIDRLLKFLECVRLRPNELLPRAVEMDVGEGLRMRVLDLDAIIAIKERLAFEKDLATLPILRRTLIEARKKQVT
jgi:predicted nucleotidyltransferase